jgi:hypothetical protein
MKLPLNSFKTLMLFSLIAILPSASLSGQTTRLIVIDPLVVAETGNLVNQPPLQKVLRLPDKGNPITLITAELKLASYDEVDLYLLTKPASVIFDEINILPDNINDFAADFGQWKDLLKPGARIIIHSANLTSEPGGEIIVRNISAFTGRNVTVEN